MERDRRPQQHAAPFAADPDIGEVQRGERTVCQHSVKRRRAEPFGQQATPRLIKATPAKRLTTSAYTDDLGT